MWQHIRVAYMFLLQHIHVAYMFPLQHIRVAYMFPLQHIHVAYMFPLPAQGPLTAAGGVRSPGQFDVSLSLYNRTL